MKLLVVETNETSAARLKITLESEGYKVKIKEAAKPISEQIEAEEALREGEATISSIFRAAPIGIGLVSNRILKRVNDRICQMTGYSRDELLEKNARVLYPIDDDYEYVGKEKYNQIGKFGMGSVETRWLRKDGKIIDILLSSTPLDPSDWSAGVTFTALDITERKQAEETLKASLLEKEVLLKEVHHRVKNNLQVISSLMNLQASQLKAQESKHVFQEVKNRIYSIALVHKKLYQSQDFSNINFKEYVEELVNELLRAYQTTIHVSSEIEIRDISFDIDTAIPCGLILNELISNALKHAFPRGKKGNIYISIQPGEAPFYELTVRDNGIGIPGYFNVEETDSLGMKLVKMLTDQIEGSITITRDQGTAIKIKFPQRW